MSKPFAWLAEIVESAHARALADATLAPTGGVADGSRGSSSALMAGALSVQTRRPILLVVAHLDEADDALDDLALFSEAGYDLSPMRFGALEVLPGESGVNLELLAERLGVVEGLSHTQLNQTVIVAPIQALMQGVPRPESASQFSLKLHAGHEFAPGALLDWLDRAGYSGRTRSSNPVTSPCAEGSSTSSHLPVLSLMTMATRARLGRSVWTISVTRSRRYVGSTLT